MSIQITIIGLGQIGASVGLALAEKGDKFTRVGHDIESGQANAAKRVGALDKVAFNLPAAVAEADIVLLAVPLHTVQDLLKSIAPDLKEGAVVLDVSPIRQVTNAWAKEILPAGRYFVGITPMISPLFLDRVSGGIEAADAKLFDHGLFAITAPSGTIPKAMKLATDLVEMMGALPLFADVMEIDSYMAAVHVLPQLMAGALVNTTVSRPGWKEGRKFAGRSYRVSASPISHQDGPEALAEVSLLNRENTLRVLDNLIVELQQVRGEIENQSREELMERIQTAREGYEMWISERGAANWAGEGTPEVDIDAARPNLFGRFKDMRKTDEDN